MHQARGEIGMKIRCGTVALCIAVSLSSLVCSQKRTESRKPLTCAVRTDTITQAWASKMIPGSLIPEKKMVRAALQCALTEEAFNGSCSGKDRDFYSDLSNQLAAASNESWSPEAAASLYRSAKALRAKTIELQSGRKVAGYVDSLVAATVHFQDSVAVRKPLMSDTTLGNMSNASAKGEIDTVIAEVFSIPLATAGILCEFFDAEDVEQKAASGASAYVKGLVSHGALPGHKPQAQNASVLPKEGENLKAALSYRSQKSISDSIKRHLPNLEALYKKQLKIHETLSGKVWVTFVINPDGGVASARVTSTEIAEKDFLNPFCGYVEKIHFLRIPDSVGPMTFEFPFEFSPEQ